jgi:hypothetical protein
VTTPVVFGGRYRPLRRVLSPVVGLYDAARVNPNVMKPVGSSLSTGVSYLPTSCSVLGTASLHVRKEHFFLLPCMRQYSISRNLVVWEIFKLESGGVQQAHCEEAVPGGESTLPDDRKSLCVPLSLGKDAVHTHIAVDLCSRLASRYLTVTSRLVVKCRVMDGRCSTISR